MTKPNSEGEKRPDRDYERAWRNDPQMRRWVSHVLSDMAPKMEESTLVCQIIPTDREGDVKFWVELGASITITETRLR